ncbi:MAG: ABC-type glycerol-3-phosphate transport system permease component [Candidatus Latescibacterota bacterium]|jgi:ABC-type glycerol-3-phosphate transport system permease component
MMTRTEKMIVNFLITLFALLYLSPLLWIAITSIKPESEIYDAQNFHILPQQASLTHYTHVFDQLQDFPIYCYNTLKITFATIIVVLIVSATCGYALAHLTFAGKKYFLSFILFVMAIPWMLMLMPIYEMEVQIGLLNTLPGLILPYAAMFLPIAILIMRAAFLAIPVDLRQAAQIDGASEFTIWWRIMLPITRPSMVVIILMTFLSCWKEYTYAVTLNSLPSATTLAVGITYLKDEAQSWAFGTLSAAIMIVAIPLIIAFLFLQKRIIGGLSEGALKG